MKRLLSCLQALLLVFLLVANFTAQDKAPNNDEPSNRDVSELSVDELETYEEFRQHFRIEMQAYTKRYRAAANEDKAKVAQTRPTVEIYHPLLSKLVAEATAAEAEEILSWW